MYIMVKQDELSSVSSIYWHLLKTCFRSHKQKPIFTLGGMRQLQASPETTKSWLCLRFALGSFIFEEFMSEEFMVHLQVLFDL